MQPTLQSPYTRFTWAVRTILAVAALTFVLHTARHAIKWDDQRPMNIRPEFQSTPASAPSKVPETALFGSGKRDVAEITSCPMADRRRLVGETCRGMPLTRGRSVRKAVLDHARKVMYCRLPKCANTAFLRFFHGIERPRTVVVGGAETAATETRTNMPVDELNTLYADYRKVIVVRHPLQRLVSAFYEVSEYRQLGNFTEFVYNHLLTGMSRRHWDVYHGVCQLCEVDYDVVVKTETLTADSTAINEAYGESPDVVFPISHINANVPGEYLSTKAFKYDGILLDFQASYPAQFEEVLARYQVDMQLFGYTWTNRGSQCQNGNNYCC